MLTRQERKIRATRVVCFFTAVFFLAAYVPIPVFALKKERLPEASQQEWEFYDPDAGDCNYDGGECHAPAGSEIIWIGDSYSVGAVDYIKEKFQDIDLGTENPGNSYSPYSYIQISKHLDWISNTTTNDASGGPSGVDILKTITEFRPIVVLALGTNDQVGEASMTKTLEEIAEIVGEETKVILTTAYTRGGGNYKTDNEAKIKFASDHDNFYVADWAKVAKDDYYKSDDTHPGDNDGYKAWVDTIIQALPQTCTGTSTNPIVNIDGTDYTFPLLGATKDNYLNPGGKFESELSPLPCGSTSAGACHHDYFAVDMGLKKSEVDGQEMTENDFPDIKGRYSEMYYFSTGVKVLAFVSGTITSYKYYHNNVPDNYDSKCASVMFKGDDGRKYWIGHMSFDATVHEGTHYNVGDVIGEVGPPPCAQGTQGHLHVDTEPEHEYFIVDLMNKLYDSLPDSGSPNSSYASRGTSSSSVSHGSTTSLGGDLPQATIEYLDSNNVKEQAQANMERYAYAEQQTGIPWQALAALHFREGGLRPDASISNGEGLYDHINVDGIHVSADPNQDAVDAANHLKGMAKEVYGVELTASSPLEDWGKAFLAYNRGFMYKGANPERTWDESPYVSNGMDEQHMNMTWISADSCYQGTCYNSVAGKKDGNLAGAIAVMKYLGGELGGMVDVCRNPSQGASGGLTEEQAKAMAEYYKTKDLDDVILAVGTKWNCVSFTAWFVEKFTSIGKTSPSWGNGKDIVDSLRQAYGIQTGKEPRPFSVFAVTKGVTDCGSVKCGHTGIVVAVNGDDVMTVEAAWGNVGYTEVVHRDKSWFENAQYGDTFGYLDSIIDNSKVSSFISELGI